jgi:outer membrane protein
MKFFAGLTFLYGIFFCSNFVLGKTLSWQDCIKIVGESNFDVKTSEFNLQSNEYQKSSTQGNYWPQISASLSYGQSKEDVFDPTTSYGAALSASENIFNGFQDSAKVDLADANISSAQAALKIAKAKASFDLKVAFENLAYAKDYVTLTQQILKRRQENSRLVQLRFEGGRENKGSVLLSNSYLEQAKLENLQAVHLQEQAESQLKKVLGIHPDEVIDITGQIPVTEPQGKSLPFRKLQMKTPQWQQNLAQEDAANANVKIAQASFFPTLNLTGSVGKIDDQFFPQTDKWNVGLTLNIPLFSGGKDYSNFKSAVAARGASQYTRQSNDLQNTVQLQQSYNSFVEAVAKSKVDLSFEQAQLVRAQIARGKYNNGLATFDEWDLIESDLITRQKAALSSQKDRVLSEAAWEQSLGEGVLK